MDASDPITTSTILDTPHLTSPERKVSAYPRSSEYTLSVGTVYVRVQIKSKQLRAFVVDDSSRISTNEQTALLQGPFGRDVGGEDMPAGIHCLTLLKTCKQIHHEAGKLFYICNHFDIKAFDPKSKIGRRSALMEPGLFRSGGQSPQDILRGMRKFERWIGAANAQALTGVTFCLGHVDTHDIESGSEALDIMQYLLVGPLRETHLAHPHWMLQMSMILLIKASDLSFGPMQHVKISVAEAAKGLEAVVGTLEQKISERLSLQLDRRHVHDLHLFAKYCQELRKAVMTSA
ncbi:hypothetical protein LTS10_003790 [Elasticomyces elasticus]|nr:hypothetical protein LTS10_003790 [Elasticomyces elasticus]